MHPITKIYLLDEDNQKFFGEGPFQLLRSIEETGSLRAASLSMGMAYTKALKLITQAEKSTGYALITRSTGGKHGGGSRLTKEGKELMEKYEQYRDQCQENNRRIYLQIFSS